MQAAAPVGCDSLSWSGDTKGTLTLNDFVRPPDAPATVPPPYYGELPTLAVREGDFDGDDGSEDTPLDAVPPEPGGEGSNGTVAVTAPPPAVPSAARTTEEVTSRWMIDGLVGQINGRPVFADEFLDPMESVLRQVAAMPNQAEAQRLMVSRIHDRFDALVNSELVISEAESQLTPEQQQGVFAWLRSLQEEEIASRQGSRAEASKSLEDELGMSIEEFLNERRDQELAKFLLGKKVGPRAIVSWADVERFYRQNEEQINPPPIVRLGLIRLSKRSDAEKIEIATAMFEGGSSFVEVARAVGARNEGILAGLTNSDRLPVAEVIRNHPDLTADAKDRFGALEPGVVPAPRETETTVEWYAIVDVIELPHRSIYDPDLQLEIKSTLRNAHMSIEQARYINRLRSRWISDDINLIEQRLIAIALARYLK